MTDEEHHSTPKWGLNSATYMIPRPFGEVVKWRCFTRNKTVNSDNCQDAMFLYLNDNTNAKEHLEGPKACKTVDTEPATINYDSDHLFDTSKFEHKLIYTGISAQTANDMLNTLFEGDSISFSNTSTTPDLADYTNIFQIKKITKKLDTEIHITVKCTTDSVDNFGKLAASPGTTCQYIVLWIAAFKSGKDYGNGWQGNPLAIREKNTPSDSDSIHLEIVCRQTKHSEFDMTTETDNIADFECMYVLRDQIQKYASTLKTEMDTAYDQHRKEAFKEYTTQMQTRLNAIWKTTFGPLNEKDLDPDSILSKKNFGGYVLLKPILNNRIIDTSNFSETDKNVNSDTEKRYVTMVSAYDNDDAQNGKLIITKRESDRVLQSTTSAEETSNYYKNNSVFQVIAGSLQEIQEFYYSNTAPAPDNPAVGINSYSDLLGPELSIQKLTKTPINSRPDELFDKLGSGRKSTPLPGLSDTLKIRPVLEDIEDEINQESTGYLTNTEDMQLESNAKNMHMDIKTMSNEEHFKLEFKTLIKLAGQCLLATVTGNTPRIIGESIAALPCEDVKKNSILKSINHTPDNELDVTCHGTNVKLGVNCVREQRNGHNTFTAYINGVDPWRDEDDGEYGACSSTLYEPCTQYASHFLRSAIPNLPDVGSLLVHSAPFGNMDSDKIYIIEKMIERCLDAPMFNTGILKQYTLVGNEKADDMPYQPITLQYGLQIENNSLDKNDISWSLGETPTILVEAIQLALLYLQKIMYDTYKSSNENAIDKIKEREQKSGWDTYPYGMLEEDHVAGWRSEFEGTVIHNLRTSTNGSSTVRKYSVPGTEDFYKTRDYMRKEIVYTDSLYTDNCIDNEPLTEKGVDLMGHISKNKWTGSILNFYTDSDHYEMCFLRDKEHTSDTISWEPCGFTVKDEVDKLINETYEDKMHSKRKRNHALSQFARSKEPKCMPSKPENDNVSSGYWKINTKNIQPDVYTQSRFRKYTGKTPDPHHLQVLSDKEREFQQKHVGKTFNNTPVEVKWILPAYKLWEKDDMSKLNNFVDWMAESFVGWHQNSIETNKTTEFALACNKFYDKITRYFKCIDPKYNNEPFGINVLNPDASQRNEALLLQLLYKGRILQQNTIYRKPMVVKGVVMVKANANNTSRVTKCTIDDFLVKTEAYRITESETWASLYAKFTHIRGIPEGSVPDCLAECLMKSKIPLARPLSMQGIIRLRPQVVPSLARLMLALHVHNDTWKNTKVPRYKESVHQGMFRLLLFCCCDIYKYTSF